MVGHGEDPDFGRTFLPAPIEQGPFYAMRNHGITLVTFIGVDIDADCAVRDEDGGRSRASTPSARSSAPAPPPASFCSGMLVTPALTFGRLLGTRLAAG